MYKKLYILIRTFVFRDEETNQRNFIHNTRSTGNIEKNENASLQFEKNARIIKKRTFEALQDINENFIENIVETSKRVTYIKKI